MCRPESDDHPRRTADNRPRPPAPVRGVVPSIGNRLPLHDVQSLLECSGDRPTVETPQAVLLNRLAGNQCRRGNQNSRLADFQKPATRQHRREAWAGRWDGRSSARHLDLPAPTRPPAFTSCKACRLRRRRQYSGCSASSSVRVQPRPSCCDSNSDLIFNRCPMPRTVPMRAQLDAAHGSGALFFALIRQDLGPFSFSCFRRIHFGRVRYHNRPSRQPSGDSAIPARIAPIAGRACRAARRRNAASRTRASGPGSLPGRKRWRIWLGESGRPLVNSRKRGEWETRRRGDKEIRSPHLPLSLSPLKCDGRNACEKCSRQAEADRSADRRRGVRRKRDFNAVGPLPAAQRD